MEIAGSLLDKTAPDSGLVDLLRVTVIVVTVIVIALAWRLTIVGFWPYDVRMMAALTVYLAFTIIQELQQIGKPFVWWRLPLLMLGSLLALASVSRRLGRTSPPLPPPPKPDDDDDGDDDDDDDDLF